MESSVQNVSGSAASRVDTVLRNQFGLSAFRPGQRQVVDALMAGRNAAAVFPTGGGKSLCYQLPSQCFPGITLVVSPLIALMKDQCDALSQRNIRAVHVDSTLDARGFGKVIEQLKSGTTKLLYLAPERFFNERFRTAIAGLSISLFAIDEAHCISQWGHNFRPDYLKLARIAGELQAQRILALTATATPPVLSDICSAFQIQPPDAIRTPFFRPNLKLKSAKTDDVTRDELMVRRLRERPAAPTLIYVTLQKTAEQVAEHLRAQGFEARHYHAGMSPEDRSKTQLWFESESAPLIVATIAFGMGIDKSNIRYVYHYNPAKSMESYAQEIGRAGRDGEDATCETFVVSEDRTVLENFAYGDTPDLESVIRLCEIVAGQPREFHISHYQLANETDMKLLVSRTLLTYMELDGWLESTAARYDAYQFQPHVSSATILDHFQGERRDFMAGLLSCATKGRTWFSIPIPIAINRLASERRRIVQAMDYLAQRGWITLRVSKLVHGYRKLKSWQSNAETATDYHQRLIQREESEVKRVAQIWNLLTGGNCIAWGLSSHFGEQLDNACGCCSACDAGVAETTSVKPIEHQIGRAALSALHRLKQESPEVLKTERQQARFLCGLSSHALVRSKLTRDPYFGSCANVPFQQVLAAIQRVA